MRYQTPTSAALFLGIALFALSADAFWSTKEKLLPCSSAHLSYLVADVILDEYTRIGEPREEPDSKRDDTQGLKLQEGKSAKDIRALKVAFPDIPAEDKRLCFGQNRFPVVAQTIQPSTGKLVGYVFNAVPGYGRSVIQFEIRPPANKTVESTQDTHATAVDEPSASDTDNKKRKSTQNTRATNVAELPASNAEGQYVSPGDDSLFLQTFLFDADKKAFAARVSAASPSGCTGLFGGTGFLKGNVLRLVPPENEGSANQCSVTLTFNKTGEKATVQEDNCGGIHGAACAFVGEVARETR